MAAAEEKRRTKGETTKKKERPTRSGPIATLLDGQTAERGMTRGRGKVQAGSVAGALSEMQGRQSWDHRTTPSADCGGDTCLHKNQEMGEAAQKIKRMF